MTTLLLICLGLIFTTLAGIHFYWAIGGQWGFEAALPTNENGIRVLNPKKIECIIVGLGLTIMALFYLIQLTDFVQVLPYWLFKYGGWIIPFIFILRAIGDFRYVGFFKKLKATEFARLDSRFFSPLCLGIGIMGLLVKLL